MIKTFVLLAILNTGPYIITTTSTLAECERHQQYLDKKGTVAICVEKDPKQEIEMNMAMAEKLIEALMKQTKKLERE